MPCTANCTRFSANPNAIMRSKPKASHWIGTSMSERTLVTATARVGAMRQSRSSVAKPANISPAVTKDRSPTRPWVPIVASASARITASPATMTAAPAARCAGSFSLSTNVASTTRQVRRRRAGNRHSSGMRAAARPRASAPPPWPSPRRRDRASPHGRRTAGRRAPPRRSGETRCRSAKTRPRCRGAPLRTPPPRTAPRRRRRRCPKHQTLRSRTWRRANRAFSRSSFSRIVAPAASAAAANGTIVMAPRRLVQRCISPQPDERTRRGAAAMTGPHAHQLRNFPMPHYTPLISTIVVALVLAFAFGVLAQRLRFSPLVGYLVAGILISPFTPGYVADQGLANELAEIGVILLMFGVGLHFSLDDLLSVGRIAIPGAIAQIASATALGMGLAWWLGWPMSAGFVFGLALSVASTVVLLRAMQERRLLETERGRIAVGWLIVEDLAMVLTLV